MIFEWESLIVVSPRITTNSECKKFRTVSPQTIEIVQDSGEKEAGVQNLPKTSQI